MGEPDAAHVDAAALLSIANEYEAAGELVADAVRMHLARLAFDGSTAGSAHVAAGDRLRYVVDDVVSGLAHWSRAAAETATALRSSAHRYAAADAGAAGRLG